MKQRILSISPNASVNEAARVMDREEIGLLPICDEQGLPIGVVTDRDIVLRACAENLDGEATRVEQIMTLQPMSCSVDATLEHAEELMLRHRTHRILVVDGDKKLVGLITMADVAQHESPLKFAHWLSEMNTLRRQSKA